MVFANLSGKSFIVEFWTSVRGPGSGFRTAVFGAAFRALRESKKAASWRTANTQQPFAGKDQLLVPLCSGVSICFKYAPLGEIIGKLWAEKIRCGIRGMREVVGSEGLDMEKDPVLKGSGLPVA